MKPLVLHRPAPAGGRAARRVRGRGASLAGVFLLAGTLAACSPMIHTDGNIPDRDRLASIQPGQHTRDEVEQLLGTPSSVSTFGRPTWYYISKRTSTLAFFDPAVLQQKVVAISFDDNGTVAGLRQYTLDEAKTVSPVERETPTKGKELTILDQMIGNMNRGYAKR